MRHGCIHLTHGWNEGLLKGVPKCQGGRKLHSAVRVLESHACQVLQLKWLCAWPSHANFYDGHWPVLLHTFGGYLEALRHNNQNCLSMVSNCSRTTQHLFTTVMCKIWCNVGGGMCWHILPTLQFLPCVMTGCSHMWKNIFGVNDLNWKMISTLLSKPLYIIWARMYTELHLIYHTDGKSVWTVLVIILSRGCMCKHSGISWGGLLSCTLLLQ